MKRYSAKEIFEIARALHRANFDTLTRAEFQKMCSGW